MAQSYERERAIAMDAVRAAAKVTRAVQSSLTADVLEKKDRSPVTIADYASQALICRELAQKLPDDPVIGEEDSAVLRSPEHADFLDRVRQELDGVGVAATDAEICAWIDRGGNEKFCGRFWTLDPIDGTKGFLRNEQYAISLALVVEGRIVVSALACPNLAPQTTDTPNNGRGALFTAVYGGGSEATTLAEPGPTVRLEVSTTEDPRALRFCESVESGHSAHGHSAAVAEHLGVKSSPVRLDSQAKYAIVARGEADAYLRLPTRKDYVERIWDHAGGVLIVEEAGGRVTDVDGKPLDFTLGRGLDSNRGVIVSNGHFHPPILEALRAVGV